jgi:hypothetical protein
VQERSGFRFGGRGGFYTALVLAFVVGIVATLVVQASMRDDDGVPPECYTVGRWVFTEVNHLEALNEGPGFHSASREQIENLRTLAEIRERVCHHFDE